MHSMNPFGGNPPTQIVDSLLGKSYHVVKTVYLNLENISKVSEVTEEIKKFPSKEELNTFLSYINVFNNINDNLDTFTSINSSLNDIIHVSDNMEIIQELVKGSGIFSIILDNINNIQTVSTNVDSVNKVALGLDSTLDGVLEDYGSVTDPVKSEEAASGALITIAENIQQILNVENQLPNILEVIPQANSVSYLEQNLTVEQQEQARKNIGALAENYLVNKDGSSKVGYQIENGSLRTVADKLNDFISVKDFGAKGDGVTDDTEAFKNANAFGRVVVPFGRYLLKTISITSDIEFLLGGSIIADTNETVTLQGQITSPKQFIFQGDGNYMISNISGNTGEQYKETHCSWWGIFPGSNFVDTNTIRLAKAFSAYGNAKEGLLYFDIGGYHVDKTTEVPRGVEIRGDGTRKTVFVPHSDGWPVFRTVGDGAQFSDIQFETARNGQPWEIKLRKSPAIQDDSGHCVISNVIFTNHENAIAINGNSSLVRNVHFSIDTMDGDAESSFVTITSNYVSCEGLFCNYGQSYSANSVVKIAPPSAVAIMRGITIRNIHTISHGKAIIVDATQNSIVGLNIEGINYHPIAGNKPDNAIEFKVDNSKYIQSIFLGNCVFNEYPLNIIKVSVFNSGRFAQAVFNNITAFGSSASGAGINIQIPEVNTNEQINITVGATNINRKSLIESKEDSRIKIQKVLYE